MMQTPGVEYVTSVIGYSMLSGVTNTYSGFFFVTLKPWEERKKPEEKYEAIMASLNKKLGQLPQGIAFAFSPPAIPGIGTAGGVTFILGATSIFVIYPLDIGAGEGNRSLTARLAGFLLTCRNST